MLLITILELFLIILTCIESGAFLLVRLVLWFIEFFFVFLGLDLFFFRIVLVRLNLEDLVVVFDVVVFIEFLLMVVSFDVFLFCIMLMLFVKKLLVIIYLIMEYYGLIFLNLLVYYIYEIWFLFNYEFK